MGKTIAEKIISSHAKKDVKAGDIAICDIDFCFSQDGTSLLAIDSFNQLGSNRVFDETKFCMVIDHSSPSPSAAISNVHKKMRDFSSDKGTLLYDSGLGVCHQIVPEKGHVVCGDLALGADSHTCTYGALNCLSTGVGSTDLAIVMASGKNWLKVPHSISVILHGTPPSGVFAKDVILNIIGKLTANGCTYKSAEFSGDYIENLNLDGRFTICNMAVEMGAKCAIMPPDNKVMEWLSEHSKRKPNPTEADKDARYTDTYEFDVSKLLPQVAKPHKVDNVCPVSSVEGLKIDQAFIGTCTNGRLEDLEVVSGVLSGRRVSPSVKLIIAPASKEIYLKALERGFISSFMKAGAVVISPGCGPCVGTHAGVPADGEVVISSANRNFKGRMCNPNAFIYLASPFTVAASAIEGKIVNPQKFSEG